ncbi:substrate-binding domain-containing protein [Actinobacillus pleuropneumoniae]|uniref:D-galactose/methyl-galactoside binding periplasmic protein MglB n=1 Tax=Actinobacillus pleuropneumoniae serotype 5b (strain L20) TaxID=416269 RepID=A3MZG8_ACTP2|nr:substrate-binding domain-containing protein [Actinobacillus pleuropneumoniae]ABN73554.1 D-galactose-binding periplasmic protein precursor [Actinobacillus pleuropneumoniae serovar 5b str. L20]
MKKLAICSLAVGISLSSSVIAQDTLGVSLYQYDDNFIRLMHDELISYTSENPSLSLLMNDAQNSQFVQNNQVQTLVNHKVDVLAVNLVDPNAWATVIGKAKDANLPIILFNKDPGAKAINSYKKVYYVGSNPEEAGKAQAKMIANHWKSSEALDLNHDGKMQYAVLKGEVGHPDAEKRTKAVIEELKTQGIKTEQLALESAVWNKEIAKAKVNAWLSTPQNNIEVIISNNDSMAIGALEVVTEKDKALPIYGVDATPEALNLIRKGKLAGTVTNDWRSQSRAIIDFSRLLAKGELPENSQWKLENRVLRIPAMSIDRSNISDF